MVETFYLHLEFKGKYGGWSINLPFLCNKCGVCCTLEDFLTAGEVAAKTHEHPEVHAKIRALFEALGKMWEASESEYDKYVQRNLCPFLVDKSCSIYEIRPEGCRLFPKTAFGMQTQECEPLNRFKKTRNALRKGRSAKETYHFTGASQEPIKPPNFTEKRYQTCINKLRQTGITDDELALFNFFNKQKNKSQT
jgi:Fe-S-cluster containining protein